MTCEVRNKEINSQCAELLVRPFQDNFMFFLRSDRGPHPAGFNYVTPQLERYSSP